MTLLLPAPAKLNLFLHITGRRTDGYHTLETLFQLLDFGDQLEFRTTSGSGVSLQCQIPELQTDNLILKAAGLLAPHRRRECHVHITLNKVLPMGGGLGGGSSDAATALLALNHLWQCGLNDTTLLQMGLQLGADVPLFIKGDTAFARGIGEILEPASIPQAWYVVLTPACRAETREIFAHPELTRDSPPLKIRGFPIPGTRNDCQTAACKLHPQIQEAIDWLGAFAPARMTGTGASVFASFPDEALARRVLVLKPADMFGFCAQGLNRSPVLQLLEEFAVKQ